MSTISCPTKADPTPQNSETNDLKVCLGVIAPAATGGDGGVKRGESPPPTINFGVVPAPSTGYTAWDNQQAAKIGQLTHANGSTVFHVGQLVDEWIRHAAESALGGGERHACNVVIPSIAEHPEVCHCTRQWLYKCWNAHRFVAAYCEILGQFKLKPSALIQLARLAKATHLTGKEHKQLIHDAAREVCEQGLSADAVRRWVSAALKFRRTQRPKSLTRLPGEPPKGLMKAAKIATDLVEHANPRDRVEVADVAAVLASYFAATRSAVKGMATKIAGGNDPELTHKWAENLRQWSEETAQLAEALMAKFNTAPFTCTKCGHACVGSDLTNQALWRCHADTGGCGKIFRGEQRVDCPGCAKSTGILKEADHACPKCPDGCIRPATMSLSVSRADFSPGGKLAVSYCADAIADGGKVRQPYGCNGANYVAVAVTAEVIDAYKLIPADQYSGITHAYAERAHQQYHDQDYYDGLAVTWRGKPHVLTTRTEFRPLDAAAEQPALAGRK